MNDIMSFGVHRIWKDKIIKMMNPSHNQSLIDVACGTGDIAKLYSNATENKSYILATDPNKKMLSKAKLRLSNFQNIKFKICPGENLEVDSEIFDFYSISFGMRNTSDINKTISEAFRVLKKGVDFSALNSRK